MNRMEKEEIPRRLEAAYPEAGPELHFTNPYETLVATILSAQCTDKQVNKVTPAVFARYPDVCAMAGAREEDLFPLVKSCGFKSKAGNIIAACRMIRDEYGGHVPDTREALTALPGVGRKTANVVMAVAFNKPAMPVDTHVFRVSARIGLTHNAKTPLETEKQLVAHIPQEVLSKAHHWLILHGRYVCMARKPKCEECGIKEICDFYQKNGK